MTHEAFHAVKDGDLVTHVALPECDKTEAHLIDACGWLEPKSERVEAPYWRRSLVLANEMLFAYAKALMAEDSDVRVRVFDAVRSALEAARASDAVDPQATDPGTPTTREA